MATIPLTDIPNAPTGVFTPVSNYKFPTDQVGNEARNDINRGFQGAMQDPAKAGIEYDAQMHLGQEISSATGQVAGLAMQLQAEQSKKAYEQAQYTGTLKFYQNQSDVSKLYDQKKSELPVSQWPSAWNDAAGENGANLINGVNGQNQLTPWEQRAMMHNVMHTYHTGMATATNQAYSQQHQDDAVDALTGLQEAAKKGDWKAFDAQYDAANGRGLLSKEQQLSLNKQKEVSIDYNSAVTAITSDPTSQIAHDFQEATKTGSTLKGYPNLSAENVKKLAGVVDVVKNDNIWKTASFFKSQIDAGTIKDASQFENDPQFKAMTRIDEATGKDAQAAVRQYLTNPWAGTAKGDANFNQGNNLVGTFPDKSANADPVAKQYMDRKLWIMGNVPSPQTDDLIKQLDKRRGELADPANNGNLKPETKISQFVSKQMDSKLKGGYFGDFVATPTSTEESDAHNAAYYKQQGITDQVMQGGQIGRDKYPEGAPTSMKEAQDRINSAMTKYQQANDALMPMKTAPQHGAIYNFFHPNASTKGKTSDATDPSASASVASNDNPVIPVSAVGTTYGYEKKGQANYDTNSANGIGDHENALTKGTSVALSPEIKSAAKQAGINKGDMMYVHFEGQDQPVLVRNDDTTSKKLKGRVDFYNPNGEQDNPYQDMKIVGIQKA